MATLTYNDSFVVPVGGAVISSQTFDIIGSPSLITIDTDQVVEAEIQSSTDGGINWSIVDSSFTLTSSYTKNIAVDGIIRINIVNKDLLDANITLEIITTNLSIWVIPEDVWRTAGIDSTIVSREDVIWFIERAIAIVKNRTDQNWESLQVTELYEGDNTNRLILRNKPIISLDSLTIDETSVTTSNVDVWKQESKLLLKSDAEQTTFKVKSTGERVNSVTYTYGYDPIPSIVKRAVENIAARMALANQIGGTFDDITSYTVDGIQASKGEPYTNIRATLLALKQEYTENIEPYLKIDIYMM